MKSRTTQATGAGAAPSVSSGPDVGPSAQSMLGNSFVQDQMSVEPPGPMDLSNVIAWGRSWMEGCSETPLDASGNARPEVATPANPVAISVTNEAPDPASGSFERTTVGVGERINFDAMVDGQMGAGGRWSASGGRGRVDRDGFYNWQAPGAPGDYAITYTQGEESNSVAITVLAPDSITSSPTTRSPPRAGAGMDLALTIHPLSVSFGNADWYEVPGGGVGTGYFQNNTIPHNRANGAGRWVNMGTDNQAITDTAEMGGWPAPWSQGTHSWTIPTHYRAAGGASTLFHTETQVFEILNAQGDATISKYGSSV